MEIRKKKIRNLDNYIPNNLLNKKIILFKEIEDDKKFKEKLHSLGFTTTLELGESVLPKIIGSISRFNANGKDIIRRDKPKETCYRQIMWTWYQYEGRNKVEKTEMKEVPYLRYPRDFVPPPSVFLQIVKNKENKKLIATEPISYNENNKQSLLHIINLYLELFGVCEIADNDLNPIVKYPEKKLSWKILPKGEYPWEKVVPQIIKLSQSKSGKKNKKVEVIAERLKHLNEKSPDFVAVGEAGFYGYVIYGFEKQKIYILESSQINNATYIFKDDWKILSQLTKAEILNNKYHHARIVHRINWFSDIDKYI
ncbi:hypothetical protein [Proteus terrae]|uniref:hypothetical protein n=1 Tax=Proteus terrae TaxID=1574161 RepID=UPI003075D5C9